MKNKFTTKALMENMMGRDPKDGEDFWLFSIITDDPDRPTWETRFQVVGTYRQNCLTCAQFVDRMHERGVFPKGGLQIESYQGDAARAVLAEGMRQEAEYQQEQRAQPNN